jgi:hypothetical protein
MAEPLEHLKGASDSKRGFWNWAVYWWGELVNSRFFLYLYDYTCMRIPLTKRYRELTLDQLTCRFCGNSIDLLGAWRCECGYSRPGNYFGRCPKCLNYPRYIDCPACRFTMDVR